MIKQYGTEQCGLWCIPHRVGMKDNWEMGEFGLCGPCTEIRFDHVGDHTWSIWMTQTSWDMESCLHTIQQVIIIIFYTGCWNT